MRPQPDQPRRPSRRERRRARRDGAGSRFAGRGRLLVGVVLLVLFVLLISLRGMAAFYTDYLWFDSLALGDVWRKVLLTKLTLTVLGGLGFFLLCWGNLAIAERLAPMFRPSSGDDDLIERYHELVGARAWMVRAGVAVFLALIVGVNLGSSWNEWILFNNRVDFGTKDATFHTDIGFYVFQLPFLTSVAGWLFSSLVLVLILTVLAHVVNGGIRFHTQLDRVTPQVKAHLSVLLGVLALVQTGRYWLSRYELTFSTRGTVDGATYTDVNVEKQAIYLLMAIALFATGLFIANIWRRGWVLPGMAVGMWILVEVLAGGVVPAMVQRFRVEPTESSMEAPYIANNIAATQDAYGLGDVDLTAYDWQQELSTGDLHDNVETLANVRLWDPLLMQDSYSSTQEIKPFYEINDVDVDRYTIDGKQTQVMIAARDLKTSGVNQSSWEATHLTYTHGYGVVAARADDKTSSGDPDLVAKDIPVKTSSGMPEAERPGIYFGESKSGYVIVNSDRKEIDYQDDENQTKTTSYDGVDGVRLGSGVNGFLRRSAFALRFGDVNPLISGNITPDSKVLLERDVSARLKAVAPFLAYDHDPYMVVLDDGSAKYVIDAYTTTRNYPNAQRADTGGLDSASGLYGRSFNYARNSVKAVVDAYDGTVDLYVVDDEDPIIRAYQKAFPDLFTPVSEAADELTAHFRYPEDLFTVQTQMWAKYHVSDADDFYNGNDEWNVPREPGATTIKGDKTTKVGADGQPITDGSRYQSQYVLMQLPGETEASFVLLRPYVTAASADAKDKGQNQLRSFIVASSEPGSYGKLTTYVLPSASLPDGPNLAADDIQSDGSVGDQIRSQCTTKTTCTFAAPSILPIGNSLLYVQSFFVAGKESNEPKLKQVVVSYQQPGAPQVAIASSLRGALVELFGDDVPTDIESSAVVADPNEPDPGTEEPSQPDQSVAERESALIDKIVKAFADADKAAVAGDQVGYIENVEKAQAYAQDLQELRDQNPPATDPAEGDTTTTTTAGSTTTTRPGATTTTSTTTPQTTTTTTAGA